MFDGGEGRESGRGWTISPGREQLHWQNTGILWEVARESPGLKSRETPWWEKR